jgi:hypothetical protein
MLTGLLAAPEVSPKENPLQGGTLQNLQNPEGNY